MEAGQDCCMCCNCAQWDADPATCMIVDARETQWRWVRDVTWEALLAREEEGEA